MESLCVNFLSLYICVYTSWVIQDKTHVHRTYTLFHNLTINETHQYFCVQL